MPLHKLALDPATFHATQAQLDDSHLDCNSGANLRREDTEPGMWYWFCTFTDHWNLEDLGINAKIQKSFGMTLTRRGTMPTKILEAGGQVSP